MKFQKIAKLGIAVVLVISIFSNSVGSIFAKNEKQVEMYASENYEKEIEEKEEITGQEKQTMSYTLSKSKFQDIHLGKGAYSREPAVNTVEFTDQPLPAGANAVDLSENGDGSVIGANVNGALIVTTNTLGKKVKFPSDCRYLFANFISSDSIDYYYAIHRNSIDLSNVDTSNVSDMAGMFGAIEGLTRLDLSSFNTKKVQIMSQMFQSCRDLVEIDFSSFDTRNVFFMSSMFLGCESLESLNLSSFSGNSVTNISNMFLGCTSLKNVDLSSFVTYSNPSMNGMFQNCISLTDLRFNTSNISNVKDMGYMFQNCSSLTNLDLSHFNTANVTNMEGMFQNCSSLTTIYSEEWDTSKVTNDRNMFLGVEQIAGKSEYAIVTPYDSTRIGKAMATPNDGYFTVPNLIEWNTTVNYVDENNQILETKDFLATNRKPMITTEKINEFIPNGYELVNENISFTVTQDNQVFEVVVRPIEWAVELEYQTVNGTVVKAEQLQITQLNPVITAQMIIDKVPTGYELVSQPTDWTATANGSKHIVEVREIQWTVMVEFITENSRGIVKTVSFSVGNLNPVIEAQRIIDAIPEGYQAISEVQDVRATKDGEVFQVVVKEKIETLEGIVHFVNQNGVTVKTEVYTVTNKDPKIHVKELEKALPTGAVPVNTLTELRVTRDKEEFMIEVIMPVDQEPNQPEIGGDNDITTDATQSGGSIEGVQTGDSTQVGLWIVVMGGAIGVLAYLKRKKKNVHA